MIKFWLIFVTSNLLYEMQGFCTSIYMQIPIMLFKYCTECKTVVFYKVLSLLMLDHQVFGIRQMHITLIYRQLEAITQDRNQVQ